MKPKSPFDNLNKLANKAVENGWFKGGEKKEVKDNDTEEVSFGGALEIMGDSNFFGPSEIYNTFGITLGNFKNISSKMPFSKTELIRAKELDQMLVLYVDQTSSGEPLTTNKMLDLVGGKTSKGLHFFQWNVFEYDANLRKEVPRVGWRLVEKNPLENSGDKNYLEQTELIVKHLKNVIFKDGMPSKYQEAIDDFELKKPAFKEILENLVVNKRAEPDLAIMLTSQKINQLCRESFSEMVYRIIITEKKTGEFSFGIGNSILTNSLSIADKLIGFGGRKNTIDGLGVGSWTCVDKQPYLQVHFSRS